ncbi:MAG: hypothetical protein GEV09_04515 [Pseudonocardiaceae bacterium]|nr:hypothetical protein [Pseudonocardiaceae bacterium]
MAAASNRTPAVVGVLVLLLVGVLAACGGTGPAQASRGIESGGVDPAGAVSAPTVVDSSGMPLEPEHADVVRDVYRALAQGDIERLRGLYHGDDWEGQARLLSQQTVRDEVLAVLQTHPANLGEGYVYPGFSVTGWTGMRDRADAARLGIAPAELPDPTSGYPGYQTAFFLHYNPPDDAGGPLQWRGIARLPGTTG